MGADLKMTNDSALRSARKLGANMKGAVATGAERFVKRDWLPTVKRPDFGFTDRSGDLRRSVRIRVDEKGRFVLATLTASEPYAEAVERRDSGRHSFAAASFRKVEDQLPRRIDAEVQRFIRQENRDG